MVVRKRGGVLLLILQCLEEKSVKRKKQKMGTFVDTNMGFTG